MRRFLPPMRRQAGTPARPKVDRRENVAKLTRGVVVAVHFADAVDGDGPAEEAYQHPRAVTCDVITWTGHGSGFLWNVPVMQRGSSVGNASLWVPRAPTRTLDGSPLTFEGDETAAPVDPENIDGEWVIIDFLEGDLRAPIIIGSYQHPRSRRPQNGATPGQLRDSTADGRGPELPDGIERFLAHQGAILRVDRAGNVVIDTTRATEDDSGETQPGQAGNVDLDLPDGALFVVRFAGGRQIVMRRDRLDIFAASHRMAREGDFVTVNLASSPTWAAWVEAVTAAVGTTLPALQGAAESMRVELDALLAWAAAPPPPGGGRPPLVAPGGPAAPLPPVPLGPFPFPSDQHEGGPAPAGPQAVGIITSGSSQIRGS